MNSILIQHFALPLHILHRHKDKLRKEKEKQYLYEDLDKDFSFIAGYTSGGAPYGITWDEMEQAEK